MNKPFFEGKHAGDTRQIELEVDYPSIPFQESHCRSCGAWLRSANVMRGSCDCCDEKENPRMKAKINPGLFVRSPAIFQTLAEVSGGEGKEPVTAQQLMGQLNQLLLTKLQAPLVFAPMPIQDAIDVARFLVYTSIMFSRFLPGYQMVGGPIEIAAITKHEGFKWISRKHYYDQNLNREPSHVVVDKSEKD